MTERFYVRVVAYETGDVVKQMGPMGERKADRVDNALQAQIDHDRFYTRVLRDDDPLIEADK